MIERLFEVVGSLGGPWAYLAVGALAAGESSIGLGLVVPGETGLIVGGFVVSQGNAGFTTMVLVGIAGAIVGNSIGYEIGRRVGPSIRTSRLGTRIGAAAFDRAERFLSTRGAKSVAITQFLALVRSVVPALAGVSRMPYRTFIFWNAIGGVLWATLYVTVGFFAGRSYERVAAAAEDAGLVLLIVAVIVVGVVLSARWIARNPERAQALGRRVLEWGPVAWVARNFSGPIRFVQRRFRIDHPFGLSLTLGMAFVILASWAMAALVSDVTGSDDLVRIDRPVTRWLAEHRVDWVTDTMEVVTGLGSSMLLAPLLGAVGLVWLVRTRRWGVVLFLALALGGALVATDVVKDLVARPRPGSAYAAVPASGFAFPSGHTAAATAAFGALAYIHGSVIESWARRVTVWAVAVLLTLLVGLSRLYLGVHWLTDVLGGYALAAVWVGVVVTAFSTSTRLVRQYLGEAGGRSLDDERDPRVGSGT